MKKKFLILVFCIFVFNCSNKNDFDNIISKEWDKCDKKNECVIDFAHIMNFNWDTMCFYSAANSLEEINNDLGTELKDFTDIGDRIIFLDNGKIVYHKEWFYSSIQETKGVIFVTSLSKFKVSKFNSKFKVSKKNKIFFIKSLDNDNVPNRELLE